IFSIANSFIDLMWAFLVVILILFIFGIILSNSVWKDPKNPGNGCLYCTSDNAGGLGRKVTDGEAIRKFTELKDQMPQFRAHLELQPPVPLYLARLSLANHELGDRAVRQLVEALLSGTTLVEVLELYKNRLGDASAQALAVLLENSPKPGVHGFHLSHNYFTPLGVGLLLASATRSNFYPAWRKWRGRSFLCPLWLRVEQQLVKWDVLNGLGETEQKKRADLLLAEKAATLTKRCQANGRLLPESLPEDFRLLCMPEGFDEPSEDWPEHLDRRPKTCSKWYCAHIHEDGWPMVHLPYFWSQNSDRTSDVCPEVGSLQRSDPTWRSWRPRLPVSVLGRIALKGPPSPAPSAQAQPLADGEVRPGEAAAAKQEEKREPGKQGKEPKKAKEHKSKKSKEDKEAKRVKKQKKEKKEKKDGPKRSARGEKAPKIRSKKEKPSPSEAEAPVVEPPEEEECSGSDSPESPGAEELGKFSMELNRELERAIDLEKNKYYISSEEEGGDDIDEAVNVIKPLFGSLPVTMLSLWCAISGGNDWMVYAEALMVMDRDNSYVYVAVFLFYTAFCVVGLFNVVTGVFVDSAVCCRTEDEVLQSYMDDLKHTTAEIKKFFETADSDGSGTLSYREFCGHLRNPTVKAFFHGLDIDPEEASIIFRILDDDKNDEILIEEFINGTMKLKGHATKLEMITLMYDNTSRLADVTMQYHADTEPDIMAQAKHEAGLVRCLPPRFCATQ
ncbi:unnamed protein product, partial [Symbiodinium microadriaticum]